MDKNGEGHCYTCMGCRSFLTPYVDPETGKPKYYGRFNQGVVTITLVDVALSSGGNFEKFWKIFDERLALCHKALQARHQDVYKRQSMGSFRLVAGNRHLHRYYNFAGRAVETVPKSLRLSCGSELT